MTTHVINKMPNGDTVNIMTTPGAAPIVFLNGVLQQPGSYSVSGGTVFFDQSQGAKWKSWYAWRPVCIKGKWYWFTKVYRRKTNSYVNHDDWAQYEYGDDFDMLKELKNDN